jgi:hypothetical protein
LRSLAGIEDNHEAQESYPQDRLPRHNEIGERLAMAIFTEAEAELGRRWWL